MWLTFYLSSAVSLHYVLKIARSNVTWVSVPNLPERLEKEQSVNSNLVFPSPNLPEPLDKKRGVDNNLVFSSPNLPEPLDKEQGVDISEPTRIHGQRARRRQQSEVLCQEHSRNFSQGARRSEELLQLEFTSRTLVQRARHRHWLQVIRSDVWLFGFYILWICMHAKRYLSLRIRISWWLVIHVMSVGCH